MTAPRLPGTLVTFEGPGGVGKTTITELVADLLRSEGVPVHATIQPSRTPLDVVWALNHDVYRPDLVCTLSAAPAAVEQRLRARGGHSRFERAVGSSFRETYGYLAATTFLRDQGWPVRVVECADDPRTTAGTIIDLIHRTLTESPACP
jgi:thymidylate kinase